jgi:hypothetical protein
MKIIINSTQKNIQTTFKKINEKNILNKHSDNFHFIIGGSDIKVKYTGMSHTEINSFDLTGLIFLIENDYSLCGDEPFFYSHDTCFFGDNFLNFFDRNNFKEARLFESPGCSMFMGVYNKEILEKNKNEILSYKNTQNEYAVLNELKNNLIHNESFILRDSPFLTNKKETLGIEDVYKNGVPRLIEFFPELDLYKFKANWAPKENYEMNL